MSTLIQTPPDSQVTADFIRTFIRQHRRGLRIGKDALIGVGEWAQPEDRGWLLPTGQEVWIVGRHVYQEWLSRGQKYKGIGFVKNSYVVRFAQYDYENEFIVHSSFLCRVSFGHIGVDRCTLCHANMKSKAKLRIQRVSDGQMVEFDGI